MPGGYRETVENAAYPPIGKSRYAGVMEAGALLREARVRVGLSQSELARRAAVPQSVISEYEAESASQPCRRWHDLSLRPAMNSPWV